MTIGYMVARPNISRFYERFNAERSIFTSAINGMNDEAGRENYATLMLTRLMFLYFLRHNCLLVGDTAHISQWPKLIREGNGSGKVPFLDTSLFKQHALERDNPAIELSDEAFARICAFFDTYQWQLDEDAPRTKNTITPAVLSNLFERHTNRKQTGTYYTREDITGYIATSTIVPYLFGALQKRCAVAFLPGALTWLRDNPHRYIFPAIAHGNSLHLPDEIEVGLHASSRRKRWDQPAPAAYALPGETWREVVARRQRYHELLAKIQAREINAADDLITFNLDLLRFALDYIENCQDIDLLCVLHAILSSMTIFDPTCGAGAFLLAALNVLEPLYAACINRLEQLQVGTRTPTRGVPTGRSYSIRKAIIATNLYGVDIMEEAVELCKARLYLKLLSCVKSPLELASLPYLDQNIRAGNILVEAGEERSGFSVVIGNPPYIEYEKIAPLYRLEGYKTLSTGNLYAMTVERCAQLLQAGGRLGMIVPASATCADGYRPLQQLLLEQCSLHIASFSDQRGKLFDIPHPRLCVILGHKTSQNTRVFTTTYMKPGSGARSCLFQRLRYCEVTKLVMPGIIPRYGSIVERTIHAKLYSQARCLGDYTVKRSEHALYYTRKLSWFVQVTPFIPGIWDEQGKRRLPSELKTLYFTSPVCMDIAFAALNSHLFYWFITTRSDGRNLNMRETLGFPLNMDGIASELQYTLCQLSNALGDDLQAHAALRTMHFRKHGTLTIQCLFPGHSIVILDKIDRALAQIFGFTEEELDFLLHFDRKFRLSQSFLQE